MTNDYKKNLLDYVIGNINPSSGTTEEIFKEQNDIPRNIWNSPITPNGWNDFRYEGMVAPNEQTSNLTVLYGGYIEYSTGNVYGIITLVDENFIPVKSFYEFTSGTKLRYIQYMKQAEDGTFYYIDDEAFTFGQRQRVITSQKRFVMTSNFTIPNQLTGEYEVKLRTTYIFGNTYQNFYCKNMYKDPNSAHYIFFGSGADPNDTNHSFRLLKIIGLKVNVGEANEWTLYVNDSERIFGSAIAQFNNDSEIRYRCLVTNNYNSSKDLMVYSKTYTGSATSSTIITFNDYKPYIDDPNYKKQSVFLSYDEVYFVQNNQRWGNEGVLKSKYIGLYKYNFNTSSLTTIFEKYLGNYDYTNLEAIYIDRCNTDLYIQYNTNINNDKADYYFQRLVNDLWNPIQIVQQKFFDYRTRDLFVKNNFNLLQIFMYQANPRNSNGAYWYVHQIKENYNVLNYNGEPYTYYNSLVPHQAEIYSNNKLVFARNLYNKTVNHNQTVATVQVPNNYLNNIDLNNKILIGETNTNLVDDTNVIQKNIYETLLINYINSIGVIDEDENKTFEQSAEYVNQNINIGTESNCTSTFIGKVKINYTDNTSKVFEIVWSKINKYNAVTSFSIYVNKGIKDIAYISQNEYMVYCSKEVDFEIGNVYTITQKIRTGNKPLLVQLQYNNEDINYNSEPVMVYIEEE